MAHVWVLRGMLGPTLQVVQGRADDTRARCRPLPCHPGTDFGPPCLYRCPGPAGQDTEGAGSGQGRHPRHPPKTRRPCPLCHTVPSAKVRRSRYHSGPTQVKHCHGWDKEDGNYLKPFWASTLLLIHIPGHQLEVKGGPPLTDLSLVTLEARLSAIRLFSRSRISSTVPGL